MFLLYRTKAFNACHLVAMLVEVFDPYIKTRLLDVALGRRQTRLSAGGQEIPPDHVDELDADARVFRVRSQSDDTVWYTVDLAVGWCECIHGQTGAVCKHQVACASRTLVSLPQLWTNCPDQRQRLAALALGGDKQPPREFFETLTAHSRPMLEEPAPVSAGDLPCQSDQAMSVPLWDSDDFQSAAAAPQPSGSDRALAEQLTSKLLNSITSLGDGLTDDAVRRMISRLDGIRTASALNSALHSFAGGIAVSRGGGGRKIRCQPASVARRPEGKSRGAAPLMRGRPPQSLKDKTKVKRSRNLSVNIAKNVANAKSHGVGH